VTHSISSGCVMPVLLDLIECEIKLQLQYEVGWNSWKGRTKGHIDYIIPKSSSACYVIWTIKPYVSQNTLRIIYYSYFHSVMNHGLLFWGSSTESIKIFKLQKKMIRIIMDYKSNHLCRELFVVLGILPLYSQYIFPYFYF
jgi:hypothetical protein